MTMFKIGVTLLFGGGMSIALTCVVSPFGGDRWRRVFRIAFIITGLCAALGASMTATALLTGLR